MPAAPESPTTGYAGGESAHDPTTSAEVSSPSPHSVLAFGSVPAGEGF